ncbi:MAG: peptidoglycan DD-metalloendopeptidase family protein [Balneolales bacterium]
MKLFYYLGLSAFLVIILNLAAGAQDYNSMRQELQEEQNKARSNINSLREQIEAAEQQISRVDDEYNRVYQKYQNLEREIALRDEVIINLQDEGRHLLQEIDINRQSIKELADDLERLIGNYQKTLTYLYKNGRIPDVALLLTAGSINQMLIRSYYLNRFDEYRQDQSDQIEAAQEELEKTKNELVANQEKNDVLLAEKQSEQEKQRQGISQQQEIVENTRRNRQRWRDRLASYESEVDELEDTLSKLINDEVEIREAENNKLRIIEAERKRRLAEAEDVGDEAAIARYSSPSRSAGLPSEEEMTIVEESFSKAKGELPWPVEYGAISAQFGNKVNPLYGTKVNNPGVEIATEAQSPVKVVHDGYVFAVQSLPGFGTCIFVNHGRYITVYGNLSEVRARRNAHLKAGDIIGLSGDDNSLKGQALFFMVREGNINLDPEQWITRN